MKIIGAEDGKTGYMCGPNPYKESFTVPGLTVNITDGITSTIKAQSNGLTLLSICSGSRALLYAATTASLAIFTASF